MAFAKEVGKHSESVCFNQPPSYFWKMPHDPKSADEASNTQGAAEIPQVLEGRGQGDKGQHGSQLWCNQWSAKLIFRNLFGRSTS